MAYSYKFVQVPRDVVVAAPSIITGRHKVDLAQVAAQYVDAIVSQQAGDGWEFYRIDTIGVEQSPGCLGGLLGHKATYTNYNIISFRKPA